MKPLIKERVRFALVILAGLAIFGWIITPSSVWTGGARRNARRAVCQSSLKQIGLALRMYANDYDDCFPSRQWGKSLLVYAKDARLFQCPEANSAQGRTDYFFNSRFLGAVRPKISSPSTLILMGDGQDAAPLDATLSQLPEAWRADRSSPAWRHLNMANYAFADGHVKSLKADRVSRDFRMVMP